MSTGTETDFGWHTDPLLGMVRVSYNHNDQRLYAFVARSGAERDLAVGLSLAEAQAAMQGCYDDARTLDWFITRMMDVEAGWR